MKKLSLLILLSLLTITVTHAQWRTLRGEGPTVKQEIELPAVEGLGLGIVATVYVMKGDVQKVEIEAQQNIIDNIERKVDDGVWGIEYDEKVGSHDDVVIYVTIPRVKALAIGGSGKIIGKDAFPGMGDMEFSIGGSGSIEFAGTAEAVEISIAGSGNVQAGELKADRCEVSIAGSGNASIEVDKALDVSIAGSGDVKYKGNPSVNSSVAGSGKVRSMN